MTLYITYFEIAAFIASVLALPVLRKSPYLRLYPLLLLVVVSVEVYMTFFRDIHRHPVNANIYNIQVPIQYILYISILYLSLHQPLYRRLMLGAGIFFVFVTVCSVWWLWSDPGFNVWSYCVGTLIIIVGILMKFYEMLQNPADFNFLRNPFFYLLFAYLLFAVGTLPYFTMSNWLYMVNEHRNILYMFWNVMSILNYILYTTYTVVFLWMIQKKVSS